MKKKNKSIVFTKDQRFIKLLEYIYGSNAMVSKSLAAYLEYNSKKGLQPLTDDTYRWKVCPINIEQVEEVLEVMCKP